ncbi:calcium/proton exchanger, partial [Lactarius hatsudake]
MHILVTIHRYIRSIVTFSGTTYYHYPHSPTGLSAPLVSLSLSDRDAESCALSRHFQPLVAVHMEQLVTGGSMGQQIKSNFWSILRELRGQFRRPKLLKEAPNIRQSIRAAIRLNRSWWNILLIFVLPSLICYTNGVNSIAVFCLSFLAIIPLSKIQSIAADEILKRAGSVGWLFDVTLRNTVELIVTIQAIRHCEPKVAQSSLVGSIISNLLLILGMSIFIGGVRFSEQTFGMNAAQIYTSLLMLGVTALLLPTLFYKAINATTPGGVDLSTDTKIGPHILAISHGVVVILLCGGSHFQDEWYLLLTVLLLLVYICFQFFQRFSHQNIWGDNDPSIQKSVEHTPQIRRMLRVMLRKRTVAATISSFTSNLRHPGVSESENGRAPQIALQSSASSEEEQDEGPQMCLSVAIAMFAPPIATIFFIGGALVTSIDDLASSINVSQEFASLIVLSLTGNVEEIKSAAKASFKDKPSEALAVTVGSSIETALLIFPFTATLAWIIHKPLPLLFDTFEAVVLFFSVLIVNYVIQDGKSNWLEGMILMCIYAIFAVTFGFYPGSDPASEVVNCV